MRYLRGTFEALMIVSHIMRQEEREPSGAGGKDERKVRRLPAVIAVALSLVFIFLAAVKVHATWMVAEAPTGWNRGQLARIDRATTRFKFAVFGDTHNSTLAFDRLRKDVEKGRYLFAIDNGDMAIDSGNLKARLFINQVSGMKTPVLVNVGNHDIAAGGYANYEKVYGPRYYSFTVGKCLFIMLDDAEERSIGDKQMKWFRSELQKNAGDHPNVFVFMHVPTFRGRRDLNLPMNYFLADRASAEEFKQVCIENKVKLVFSSHCHTFDYDIWPGDVHYIVTGGGGGRLWDVEQYRGMYHYIAVTVDGEHGQFELMPIAQKGLHFHYQYIEEPWVYIYTYSAVHYFWLAIPLGAVIAALAAFALRGKKRQEPA